MPNFGEMKRVIDRYEKKMKGDLKDLEKRQRLVAEEEKSSKESIEREKKKERESIEKERQSAMLDLRKEAEVVKEERKKWELEKKRMQDTQTFEKIVTLNVGGTKYTTSLSTLTKYPDSMLGAMFSGRHALPQQEDGSFFIDRDGDTFSHILSYLRDRNIVLSIIPVLSTEVRLKLLYEAKFYQLQELEDISRVMAAPNVYDIMSYYTRNKSRKLHANGTALAGMDLDYAHANAIPHPDYSIRGEIRVVRAKVTKNTSHPLCFEEAVTFLNCNLSEVSFERCCFEGPVSFEGCLMQGTIFQKVSGLVKQKVHFAPWQVSQATFDDGLLKALEVNGCIY